MRADAAAAWLAADAAAAAQGITMCLADGKRSRAQQQETYDDYVTQYGQAMADQYVLPPEKSAHVLGLGHRRAALRGLHLAGGHRRRARLLPDLRQRGLALRVQPGLRRRPAARPGCRTRRPELDR